MELFAKLFRRKAITLSSPSSGRGTGEADAAIREARAGRIAVQEMLRTVLAAQIFVPLAGPPRFEGKQLASWKPATVHKQANGASFLLAFTDIPLATSFSKSSPEYNHGLLVEAQWLLTVLPPNHGVAFNVGGTSAFDWSPEGIAVHQLQRHQF